GMHKSDRHHVLMIHEGHWRLTWSGGEATLAPGDTCAIPPGLEHGLAPSMTGTCSAFRVINTDDGAGPTATDLN
ncbi:MAG: AraC family ligand binding domain-containing protein, partial [Pseudomonadota bacterium]